VFFAAVGFSLARRCNLLLVALLLGLCLYLEFGPIGLSVDRPSGNLHYMMVFKQQRFLLMLTAPFLVLAAWLLRTIDSRNRAAAVLMTLVLFITSLAATAGSRDYYRSGLADLRSAADDVRLNTDKVFFGDLWAILHLRIFTRYKAQNLATLEANATRDRINDGCIMLGGSRGVELLADYVESTVPGFARTVLDSGIAPPDWTMIKEIKGERSAHRRHDFRIYCVP
jgi:hypothetical protein